VNNHGVGNAAGIVLAALDFFFAACTPIAAMDTHFTPIPTLHIKDNHVWINSIQYTFASFVLSASLDSSGQLTVTYKASPLYREKQQPRLEYLKVETRQWTPIKT
jgi:hypothetical protein